MIKHKHCVCLIIIIQYSSVKGFTFLKIINEFAAIGNNIYSKKKDSIK